MLQRKNPDDYVIATGERHSVREFAGVAFPMCPSPIMIMLWSIHNCLRPADMKTLLENSALVMKDLG